MWLRFEQGTEADLEIFLAGVLLGHPIRLILTGDHWGPRACRIIAALRPGIDLRYVALRGTPIGDYGLESLINSTALASVRSLGVERCGLTDLGIQVLTKSPHLGHLRGLYLCNREGIATGIPNDISDVGAMAVAASLHLGNLEDLDLWNTSVGDQGLEALVASPYLAQLASVTAWGTRLTREGADRVKAVAQETWERREEHTRRITPCSVYTDYDERTIRY
jgi:hypothetical protein